MRINRIANQLIANGLQPNQRIAILGCNSVDYATVFLAALRAGICVTPLPVMASRESLVMMINDSDAKLLFASPETLSLITPVLHKLKVITPNKIEPIRGQATAGYSPLDDYIESALGADPAVKPQQDWMFNLIYSSGTTGTPKGIIHNRQFRAIESAVFEGLGFNAETRGLVSTPLYSQTSLFFLFAALSNGGSVFLMEKFTPETFLRLSETEKITHTVLVPVQYKRLLETPSFKQADLNSYCFKCSTSAPLSPNIKQHVLEQWPEGGLWEFYGMTEGGVNCCLAAHERPDKLDTVGQPAPGCDLRVIDDQGREVPAGTSGEIVGTGSRIMVGYHNQPKATTEASWYDDKGRRFHRSGDIGWLDEENFLHLLDRKKDMIISGGFNVYAVDLEKVLLDHPDVEEAAVIARPDERWGEVPFAFVVGAVQESDLEALKNWANNQLGKAQRISDIRCIDELPRSPIGKVLKRDLRSAI